MPRAQKGIVRPYCRAKKSQLLSHPSQGDLAAVNKNIKKCTVWIQARSSCPAPSFPVSKLCFISANIPMALLKQHNQLVCCTQLLDKGSLNGCQASSPQIRTTTSYTCFKIPASSGRGMAWTLPCMNSALARRVGVFWSGSVMCFYHVWRETKSFIWNNSKRGYRKGGKCWKDSMTDVSEKLIGKILQIFSKTPSFPRVLLELLLQ